MIEVILGTAGRLLDCVDAWMHETDRRKPGHPIYQWIEEQLQLKAQQWNQFQQQQHQHQHLQL